MAIEVCCPDCGQVVVTQPQDAHRSVLCPGCRRPLQVPRRPASSPRGGPTKTLCPRCGAKIQIAASLLGRQIACNTCRTHLLVSLTVTEVGSGGVLAPAFPPDEEPAPAEEADKLPRAPTPAAPAVRAPLAPQAEAVTDEPEFTVTAELETEDTARPPRRIPPWAIPLAITAVLGGIVLVFFISSGDILDLGRRPIGGAILGAELQNGEITFVPMGPPDRPTATTTFRDGRYQFDRDNGPAAGLHRVSVKFGQQTPASQELSVPAVVPEEKPWELDISLR
ncbi:MAG: hypothetical protein GXY83_05760 [Rhodopirellula sp.]|nr:hypothetical protein [Rhodopirellula sp.]